MIATNRYLIKYAVLRKTLHVLGDFSLSRYHPECSDIERVSGHSKAIERRVCDYSVKSLLGRVPPSLGFMSLSLIRNWARISWLYVEAYATRLEGYMHFLFYFILCSTLLFSSLARRRFYPRQSSGQTVVTGVVLSPSRYVALFFWSRIGFSIPTARRISSNVANSRSRAFRLVNFLMQEKVPASMRTR